ncbi:MAG TPA: GNAT family N-acetyltransferase [Xanthomonadales bacterium]|nr:GNAT family N-acetyltransferase [Xanthomonadales bacterium]
MPEPTAIRVRAAQADDLTNLVAWNAAMAWETEHKRLDPDTLTRGVAAALSDPGRGRYFVAERAGTAVGSLLITTEWSDWRCADWWWIQSVYVDPEHRRTGVFQALYQHVEALARTNGEVCGLRLYVEKDNGGAQATYGRLGMRDAGYYMFEASLPGRFDPSR